MDRILLSQDWGGSHVVQGRGGGKMALEILICTEGQRKRVRGLVMNKGGSNISRQTLHEGSLKKETLSMPIRKKAKDPGHQGRRLHVTTQEMQVC